MRHLCVGFSYIKDTILHRAQHLVSASSGPLKGFVMPVSLRAQWSSERSSKNSSSPSLPFFRDVAFVEKNITWIFVFQQFDSVVSLTCTSLTSLCQVLCRCVDAKCANTWIPASVSAILPTCQTHPVSAANSIANYRASNSHTSLRVSTFSSQWFLLSLSFTLQPVPNVRLLLSFFFGWMATASPANNHGRITSGGFYRYRVETTCSLSRIFKTRPFVFGVLVSHRTLQWHRRNTGSVSVQICAETSWSGDEGRNVSQCKQLNTTIWKLFAQFL